MLREKHVSHRVRGTLVVAEIAMAMMLLVGGALLIAQLRQAVECRTWIQPHERADVSGRAAGPVARRQPAFADRLVVATGFLARCDGSPGTRTTCR